MIKSPGGLVDEGIAIYNALKRHPGRIITINDSIAASIASVIYCVGDDRLVAKQAHFMLHSPYVGTVGNATSLRHQADVLEKYETTIIEIYREAFKSVTAEDMKQMLAEETWLSAGEAIEMGISTAYETTESSEDASPSKFPFRDAAEKSQQRLETRRQLRKLADHQRQASDDEEDKQAALRKAAHFAAQAEKDRVEIVQKAKREEERERRRPRTRRELEIVASHPEKIAYRMIERERDIEQQEEHIRAKFPRRIAESRIAFDRHTRKVRMRLAKQAARLAHEFKCSYDDAMRIIDQEETDRVAALRKPKQKNNRIRNRTLLRN